MGEHLPSQPEHKAGYVSYLVTCNYTNPVIIDLAHDRGAFTHLVDLGARCDWSIFKYPGSVQGVPAVQFALNYGDKFSPLRELAVFNAGIGLLHQWLGEHSIKDAPPQHAELHLMNAASEVRSLTLTHNAEAFGWLLDITRPHWRT